MQHHNLILEHFHHSEKKPVAHLQSLPQSQATTTLLPVSEDLLFQDIFYEMESYSICFCVYVWLILRSIMSSRLTHVVVCVRILFPVLGWIIVPWMDRSHFLIHSSISGHLGCFHLLAIVNTAPMNVDVLIQLSRPYFAFFWVHSQKWNCRIIW